MMRFRLSEYGQVFSTRPRGRELLAELNKRVAGESAVELDFADVVSVSYSFADAFLGELMTGPVAREGRLKISLVGMAPNVMRVIAASLDNRGVDAGQQRVVGAVGSTDA